MLNKIYNIICFGGVPPGKYFIRYRFLNSFADIFYLYLNIASGIFSAIERALIALVDFLNILGNNPCEFFIIL